MQEQTVLDNEQKLCVSCGLCCDGTLFDKAVLQKGEKGNLPEKIEEKYFVEGEQEYFRLPCHYFTGKCSIYHLKKAHVCSSFKCQLLRGCVKGKVEYQAAESIVVHAKTLRKEIYDLTNRLFVAEKKLPFRELHTKLLEVKDKEPSRMTDKLLELLLIKCQIFEVLLTRHFRPDEEFQEMIIMPATDSAEVVI